MIAALPMYDWPAIRAETDAFWAGAARHLAAQGVAAPGSLTRLDDPAAAWSDPDLLLGQACSMPYVAGNCGSARVIGRPDHKLPDAAEGLYRSVIVVRGGETPAPDPDAVLAQPGRRVAVNEWGSYSGHVALRAHLAALRGGAAEPFFGAARLSGSHAESARMVARAEADVAALDGVAWALLRAHETETARRLTVIGRTDWAPALPFISAPRHAALARDLVAALDAAATAGPLVPGLPRRVAPAGDADYAPIRAAARLAARETFAPGAPAVPRV